MTAFDRAWLVLKMPYTQDDDFEKWPSGAIAVPGEPFTLYHMTSADLVEQILREGLKGTGAWSGTHEFGVGGKKRDGVYGSPYPEDVWNWYNAGLTGAGSKTPAVIEITVPPDENWWYDFPEEDDFGMHTRRVWNQNEDRLDFLEGDYNLARNPEEKNTLIPPEWLRHIPSHLEESGNPNWEGEQ